MRLGPQHRAAFRAAIPSRDQLKFGRTPAEGDKQKAVLTDPLRPIAVRRDQPHAAAPVTRHSKHSSSPGCPDCWPAEAARSAASARSPRRCANPSSVPMNFRPSAAAAAGLAGPAPAAFVRSAGRGGHRHCRPRSLRDAPAPQRGRATHRQCPAAELHLRRHVEPFDLRPIRQRLENRFGDDAAVPRRRMPQFQSDMHTHQPPVSGRTPMLP